MALQLIYTSAPRLLQAGRTGFGTVAMHQGIPAWLQGEIERASQFSRVPGLDPSRVVTRHMVFGQGDRTHHVLSRIQDAGADYTGRTNHIAHHFIFTAAEAAHATTQGVTPADALKYLESHGLWATNWSGEPRYLTEEESLPVESIPKELTLPDAEYWVAFFPDQPESAAILAPGKTAEACWIIYPPNWRDYIVYLMGKSLALHKTPWTVSFSNDLQPTDDEQQISWRGIPSDSPLLSKAQSSVRPSLDLSNPAGIHLEPVPEYIEEARTGLKPQPKSRSPIPVATPTPVRSDVPEPARASSPVPVFSKIPEKTRRKSHGPRTILIGAVVVLLALGGGIFLYQKIEHQTQVDRLKQEIAILLQDHPSLERISSIEDVQSLKDFGESLKKGDTVRADQKLKGLPSGNPDWDAWREFCNTKLTERQDQDARKKLKDSYAVAVNNETPSKDDVDSLELLIRNSNSENEIWGKAVEALNFLMESAKVSKETKEFPLESNELPQGENKETSIKLLSKVDSRKNEIKILRSKATELDADGIPVEVGGLSTGLVEPATTPGKATEKEMISIYVVKHSNNQPKLPKLRENFKSATRSNKNIKLDWSDLNPDSKSNAWGGFYYTEPDLPFWVQDPMCYVVEKNSINEKIDDAVEINNFRIKLKSEFKNFITRFKDANDNQINFIMSSIHINNSTTFDAASCDGMEIVDPWEQTRKALEDDKQRLQQKQKESGEMTTLSSAKKFEIDGLKNTKHPNAKSANDLLEWNDFKQKVDKAIKGKTGKLSSFKNFWNSYNESMHVFVERYNKLRDDKKEFTNFSESFRDLPDNLNNWFFFKSGDWTPEDQKKFIDQFDTAPINKLNNEKTALDNQIKPIRQEIQRLNKLIESHENKLKEGVLISFKFENPEAELKFSTTVTLTPPQTTP